LLFLSGFDRETLAGHLKSTSGPHTAPRVGQHWVNW